MKLQEADEVKTWSWTRDFNRTVKVFSYLSNFGRFNVSLVGASKSTRKVPGRRQHLWEVDLVFHLYELTKQKQLGGKHNFWIVIILDSTSDRFNTTSKAFYHDSLCPVTRFCFHKQKTFMVFCLFCQLNIETKFILLHPQQHHTPGEASGEKKNPKTLWNVTIWELVTIED